jgi:hypothetical protein
MSKESILRTEYLVFLFYTLSVSVSAQVSSPLGERINVMECSHAEVVAYMDLPNPERRAMNDFHKWQTAFKAKEATRAESDPRACVATLYGDLGVMADKLKAATAALFTPRTFVLSEVTDKVMEALSESICNRVNSTYDSARGAVLSGYKSIKSKALNDLTRKYGQRAMENYVTDALIAPELQQQGLKYRNGEISADAFRSSTRSRWNKELKELRQEAFNN